MARLKAELGMLDEVQRKLVSAMEENGRGDYALARELCDAVLAASDANDVQRATAHFVAAVCSIRLEDAKSAEVHLGAFDALEIRPPPGSPGARGRNPCAPGAARAGTPAGGTAAE